MYRARLAVSKPRWASSRLASSPCRREINGVGRRVKVGRRLVAGRSLERRSAAAKRTTQALPDPVNSNQRVSVLLPCSCGTT